MNDWYDRLKQYKEQYESIFAAPITEQELNIMQSYAGWNMPDDYLRFLKLSSGAMVGAYPVYGANPIKLMDKNLNTMMAVTQHYRDEGWRVDKDFIVVSENHAGDPLLLNQTGYLLMPSHDGFSEQRWPNFSAFLQQYCLA